MSMAVIFGGTGFIGRHFAVYLLESGVVDKVLLADIKDFDQNNITSIFTQYFKNGKIQYESCDVRKSIGIEGVEGHEVRLIANFAAIHREPGHLPFEYFETNLLGAENVCNWAEEVECDDIIFTSSIAPYGPTEDEKDEGSIPVPITAYGSSKLVAEKIHIAWQHKREKSRRLVIVRPGVIFGAGEGGNVSRLIKAIYGRYFFYMGNKNTVKACAYVKELCNAMMWGVTELANTGAGIKLFNMAMNPNPSVKEYVDTICKVGDIKRIILNVPFFILYPISYVIDFFAKIIHVNQPISPVRIKKLVRSNNIVPKHLIDKRYDYIYTFEGALEDWRNESIKEWKK